MTRRCSSAAKRVQRDAGTYDEGPDHELRARAYAALRDRDGTLSALRPFIDAGRNMPSKRLRAMSVFDWLNEDPEYQALLAELDAGAERIREDLRRKPVFDGRGPLRRPRSPRVAP